MAGFFQKQEMASDSRPDGKILSCISCGGFRNCKNPKIPPYGNFSKGIMLIGSGTTETDDIRGKALQGKEGKYLRRTLEDHGIDMYEDCIMLNATRCHLTDEDDQDREATKYELDCCRKLVLAAINQYKPKVIILLGKSALYSMIGHRWKKDLDGISKWRGWCIPDQDYKAWICPVFDPCDVVDGKQEIKTIFDIDIAEAISHYQWSIPIFKQPEIVYLEDDLSILNKITDGSDIAFDYETTGLKPHAKGHKIICASVAVSDSKVYTFMIPKGKKKQPLLNLLTNPKIGKIAQNMKFEDNWSEVIFGVTIVNWVWDTMIASHILDNRSSISNLKFQVYVQFGIVNYDSEITPYIKATDEKNANSINKMMELVAKPGGIKSLLKYCAMDSITEFRLAQRQRAYIELPF